LTYPAIEVADEQIKVIGDIFSNKKKNGKIMTDGCGFIGVSFFIYIFLYCLIILITKFFSSNVNLIL
jgi:hypothetical protein